MTQTRLKTSFIIGLGLIGAFILVLYSVSLGHNFLFDEENIILHNRFIKDFSSLHEIFTHGYFPFEEKSDIVWNVYYRPLTTLTFAFDYFIWKANPLGYNLGNMLLHFIVSALLFSLLRKMLQHEYAALLAALLYSVHTLHTEAVTYIASRGDLIGAIFLLTALHFYWDKKYKRVLLCYVLGLFSKESLILLPIYLYLMDLIFLKTRFLSSLKKLAPFMLIAVLFVIFRKYFSPAPLGPPSFDWTESMLRFFSMGPAFLSYLQACVIPETFKFCMLIPFAKTFSEPVIFLTIGIIILVLTGWVLSLKKGGAAFFGMSFFLISLLPSLQLVHYEPEWAEHYMYLPAMGLAILLGCFIKYIFTEGKKALVVIFLILYVPFFFFISMRTWERNKIYNDTDGYYERLSTSDSPYASYGYGYKARVAIEEGRWKDVIVPLKTANAMNPKQHMVYDWMGLYYFQANDYETALVNFEKAYEYCSFHDSRHLVKKAMTLYQMGRFEESAKTYEKIQEEHPKDVELYTNLLMTYELLGDAQTAKKWAVIGIGELAGEEKDEMLLRMVYLRMAYRQGWEDIAKAQLDYVSDKYPDAYWYGDIVKLLKAELSAEEFETILNQKYPGAEFRSSARLYVLMSFILRSDREGLARYVVNHGPTIESEVKGKRLFEKEWEKALAFLHAEGT